MLATNKPAYSLAFDLLSKRCLDGLSAPKLLLETGNLRSLGGEFGDLKL